MAAPFFALEAAFGTARGKREGMAHIFEWYLILDNSFRRYNRLSNEPLSIKVNKNGQILLNNAYRWYLGESTD